MAQAAIIQADDGEQSDYDRICAAIDYLSSEWREQPALDDVAAEIGLSPAHFHKLFSRWAGISPKEFIQTLTLKHARQLLDDSANIFDATYDSGLSSPSRLHDLFVTYDALSPGEYKARGAGLNLSYGWASSPFGDALVIASPRGITGLAFADNGDRQSVFDDMVRRLPLAHYSQNDRQAAQSVETIFTKRSAPLNLHLIGTNFEVRVWQQLIRLNPGQATTYSGIANAIENPKSMRAVGGAVGRNPISFVVPCHRVIGKSGALTGYHWGLTRKKAMIGWELGQTLKD